jgi:hypothetical protein
MSRRRKQHPAWSNRDRQPSIRGEHPVRRTIRRPVRAGFTRRSFAWIGGVAAAAVAAVSLLIASATNHPASPLPLPKVASGKAHAGDCDGAVERVYSAELDEALLRQLIDQLVQT